MPHYDSQLIDQLVSQNAARAVVAQIRFLHTAIAFSRRYLVRVSQQFSQLDVIRITLVPLLTIYAGYGLALARKELPEIYRVIRGKGSVNLYIQGRSRLRGDSRDVMSVMRSVCTFCKPDEGNTNKKVCKSSETRRVTGPSSVLTWSSWSRSQALPASAGRHSSCHSRVRRCDRDQFRSRLRSPPATTHVSAASFGVSDRSGLTTNEKPKMLRVSKDTVLRRFGNLPGVVNLSDPSSNKSAANGRIACCESLATY